MEVYTQFTVNKISNISFLFHGALFLGSDLGQTNRAWVYQHSPVHHPKNHVLGFHGWDETVPRGQFTWSVVFIYFQTLFSHAFYFSSISLFFPRPHFSFLFFPQSLNPNLFFGTPTYLHLPSTTTQPIYLLHSTHPSFVLPFISKAWEPGRASLVEFKV